jgi:predicted DNA-binding transcriptional regulator YafY
MRISRLFEMVHLLLNKKIMTAKELAAHFEVSGRTILRDIDILAEAGIPIYTTQGRGGGVSIHENYILNKNLLSEDDQKQILFALQGMAATQHLDTASILGRLRSFFAKAEQDWIEVDFTRWGADAPDRAKFDSLKNAIIHERGIVFSYSGAYSDTSDRRVYPLKLIFKAKFWYLQAFCLIKKDYRLFKISRMGEIKILAETFSCKDFPAPALELSEFKTPALIDVKLHFAPLAAFRVYDEFDEGDLVKNEDGSLTITLSVPNDNWLYAFVLSFGDSVEVMAPESVRQEILHYAEKIKSKYLTKI